MPRKIIVKKKRTFRKKKVNIYRKKRNYIPVGFPKSNLVKLRYVDYCSLNPGVGTIAQHIFKANGLYDPNTTGVGHQPMGFDQWSLFYNHYTVIGSKITATFNTPSTAFTGLLIGINLNDDVNMSTDALTVMEQGLTKYRLGNFNTTAGGGNGLTISRTFSNKKFFKIKNPSDNINRTGAPITADPTELANYIIFFGAPPGDTTDFTSLNAVIKIEYIVIFSEPRDLSQS